MQLTGGAIVLEKRFWYLVGFKWTEGCRVYKDEIDAPAILSVWDSDGNIMELESSPCTLPNVPWEFA